MNKNSNSNELTLDPKVAKFLGLRYHKDNNTNQIKSFEDHSNIKKQKFIINEIVNFIRNKLFDSNEKQIDKLRKITREIELLESKFSKMSQKRMKKLVAKLKKEFQAHFSTDNDIFLEKNKSWLETKQGKKVFDFVMKKIPLCYALIREVAYRTSNHKHFPVQLMAGVALAQGKIIEFKTGEGKTLVAPLALFIYSLFGRGVYLVTVNDYLARRDGEWVGHMMDYIGLTVGVLNNDRSYKYVNPELLTYYGKSKQEIDAAKQIDWSKYNELKGLCLVEVTKKDAYECDITYGTNSEFGFDYLRDNNQMTFEDMNQRDPFFCIIDEVDSILIDEARVPLIISDVAKESNDLYIKFARLVKKLESVDYVIDEKDRTVTLTPSGIKKMESWLSVNNIWDNHEFAKHLDRALMAQFFYKKDDEYIVHNNQIIIVDEFTGRLQPGRRYSDGIHQAIEAKEGIEIRPESRIIASITYQNYFRLFPILSGMTGTAMTEAEEFKKIYNLDVIEIPTNKPVIRKDLPDLIYKDQESKFRAIVKEIKEKHSKGQPILVGTVSVEKSEKLSKMLKQEGIKHEVLNAKNHAREAEIVAKAGEKYAVTISTNMAGRGTDIRLGEGVRELGGLYVIGTERHESRRIDNQLRGRAGRQGDPGITQFFLAFDDEVLRIYGGDVMKRVLTMSNVPSDMPFQSKFLMRSVESAQKYIEAENFEVRKNLVEYDDVLNKQRLVIYARRKSIIKLFNEAKSKYLSNKEEIDQKVKTSSIAEGEFRLRDYVLRKLRKYLSNNVDSLTKKDYFVEDQIEEVINVIFSLMPRSLFIEVISKEFNTNVDEFRKFLLSNLSKSRVKEQLLLVIDEAYDLKEIDEGFLPMREIEKYVILESIDTLWVEHLQDMDSLRSAIGFQGYGQRDPLNIYQNEGFILFEDLIKDIDNTIAKKVLNYTTRIERLAERFEMQADARKKARLSQKELEAAFLNSKIKK